MASMNRVVLMGNLTRDPELRNLPSGSSVCSMRIAVNDRRKTASGEWEEYPSYFNITVFGKQGENCSEYLAKGRGIAVDGKLRWREWEKDGQKREAIEIVADSVQFLPDRNGGSGGGGRSRASESDIPISAGDFETPTSTASGADDDIPF